MTTWHIVAILALATSACSDTKFAEINFAAADCYFRITTNADDTVLSQEQGQDYSTAVLDAASDVTPLDFFTSMGVSNHNTVFVALMEPCADNHDRFREFLSAIETKKFDAPPRKIVIKSVTPISQQDYSYGRVYDVTD